MRNLLSGLVAFLLGRGGLKCLPITCLMLERPNPDPAEIRGVVIWRGRELNGGVRVAQEKWWWAEGSIGSVLNLQGLYPGPRGLEVLGETTVVPPRAPVLFSKQHQTYLSPQK